jgi:hypothetical protein
VAGFPTRPLNTRASLYNEIDLKESPLYTNTLCLEVTVGWFICYFSDSALLNGIRFYSDHYSLAIERLWTGVTVADCRHNNSQRSGKLMYSMWQWLLCLVHVRYTDCLQGLCSLWSSSVLFQCLLHSRMMYDADISLVFVAACSAHFFDQQLVISYDSSLSFWPLISLRTSTLEMLLLRLSVLNVFSSDTIQGPPVYRDRCMLVYVLPQCY